MEKTGQPARFSFLFFLFKKLKKFLSSSLRRKIIRQKNNVKSNVPIMDGRQYKDCSHTHGFTVKIISFGSSKKIKSYSLSRFSRR